MAEGSSDGAQETTSEKRELGGSPVLIVREESANDTDKRDGNTTTLNETNDSHVPNEDVQMLDKTGNVGGDDTLNENGVGATDETTSTTTPNDTKDADTVANNKDSDKQKEETKKKEIPSSALPACIVRYMKSTSLPESDHDYFEALVAIETLRATLFKLEKGLPSGVISMKMSCFGNFGSNTILRGQGLIATLQNLLQKLEAKREKQLEQMKKRPIIEKLLDALEASKLEGMIFRHAAVMSSGMGNTSLTAPGEMDVRAMAKRSLTSTQFSMCTVREMFADQQGASLKDLIKLVDDDSSKWLKEQLYIRSGPNVGFCAMDQGTVRVLMGLEITPAHYRKIGSSILQSILQEDETFLQTKTGKAIQNQKKLETADHDTSNTQEEAPVSFFMQAMEAAGPPEDARNIKKERIFDILSIAANEEKRQAAKVDDEPAVVPEAKYDDDEKAKADDTKEVDGKEDIKKEEEDEDDHAKSTKLEFGPYKNELTYLEDQITLMRKESSLAKLKLSLEDRKLDEDDFMDSQGIDESDVYYHGYDMMPKRERQRMIGRTPAERLDEEKKAERLERNVKQLREKIRIKIAASKRESGRDFRLEQLCSALNLEKFEKYCLLEMLKSVIAPGILVNVNVGNGVKVSRSTQVGILIENFCSTLEEKMEARRFFYKSGTLIREGILTISQQDFMTDLTNCVVELDRRLFDYLVGLDTEMSEIVDGSHLYVPAVELDDVVIPKETKKRVCEAVLNFEQVKDKYYEYEIDKKITYGLGQVLLFYGNSGTGKTMLANAVATKLKKKVLLVNFPDLGGTSSGAILKFLFREARINRAVLFFDECESLFMDRTKGPSSVNMLLTELERFDGLCILATNRAHDLDEAMHRRISLAIEFRKPDHIMRQEIWKTLQPPMVPLEDNINFSMIAQKYELTGGLIKNAWLQSLGLMVQRGGDKISQEDLMQAAGEQVVGQLSMEDFDRRVVPTCGLESMVLSPEIKDSLSSIVQYTKAQAVLFGQWGFEKIHRSTTGISTLFTGPPGTGKSMAAEAIGFDLGRPLLVVNVAELVSKWVGETGKNIQAIFADAKKKDAVLVFDEAEGLFGARSSNTSTGASRHDTMNVGLLLQYIENHPGVVIVITNMKNSIDDAFFRRFRFVLDFEMPNASQRQELWKSLVPPECPLASDVSLSDLAARYSMCGGDIKNALLRAATQAALRGNEEDRKITMSDLTTACDAELVKTGDRKSSLAMYS